jgi:hypothetical protein
MSDDQQQPHEDEPKDGYESPAVEKIDTEDSPAASGPAHVTTVG